MKREDLRNQGLTDAQIEFVMQQNGQDIEAARQSNGDAQAERARADALQQQLTALNNDLTEARNNAANAADLRRQLDAARAKIKASSYCQSIPPHPPPGSPGGQSRHAPSSRPPAAARSGRSRPPYCPQWKTPCPVPWHTAAWKRR